jgi:hypothetical protein
MAVGFRIWALPMRAVSRSPIAHPDRSHFLLTDGALTSFSRFLEVTLGYCLAGRRFKKPMSMTINIELKSISPV